MLTNNEAIKECRAEARAKGMTFKVMKLLTIDNRPAYQYVNRKTGEAVRWNLTLGLAYDICCSGELEYEQ